MKKPPCGDVSQRPEVSLTQKSRGLKKPSHCVQKHWMELWSFKSQPCPFGTQAIWSCWHLPMCLWYSRSWGWGPTTRAGMVRVHVTALRPATISPGCLVLVGRQAALLAHLLISLVLLQRVPLVPQSPLERGKKNKLFCPSLGDGEGNRGITLLWVYLPQLYMYNWSALWGVAHGCSFHVSTKKGNCVMGIEGKNSSCCLN